MNLAPIKYGTVRKDKSWPIDRIEQAHTQILRTRYYHANSWLSGKLHKKGKQIKVFSGATGSGTDCSLLIARHKSISEALERWAFQELTEGGDTCRYGFDKEPSTAGMAAYPGLFRRQTRKFAKREATERFCIHHWWKRVLGHEEIATGFGSAIRLENPISKDAVVLTWKACDGGVVTYGTAAGKTEASAIESAQIEMELSARAVTAYLKKHPTFQPADVPALENYSERQIMYYALPLGYSVFRDRLGITVPGWSGPAPQPIIDCHIPGPWEKHTNVWRVLYPMGYDPDDQRLSSNFLY